MSLSETCSASSGSKFSNQKTQTEEESYHSEELHDEISESVIRPDELDHDLVDAIIIRASEQVSATLLKQREKDREERQKLRSLWQEERRLLNQNNTRYLERVTENQQRILEEISSRFPKTKPSFMFNLWSTTSEFLKGAVLFSVLWYLWKPHGGAGTARSTPIYVVRV